MASFNPLLIVIAPEPSVLTVSPALTPMVTPLRPPEPLLISAVPSVVSFPLTSVPLRLMPPLPVFCRLIAPVVLSVPAILIAAAAFGAVAPASRALRMMSAPAVMIELLAEMMMLSPAWKVTFSPAVWLMRLSVTPPLSVMFCSACRMMLPDCCSSVPLLMVESAAPPSEKSIRLSASCASCAPLAAAPPVMMMLLGSSSSVPARPRGALVSARPRKISAPLPETSMKPPSPPCSPPRAEIEALKLVASSAHTTTLPPAPLSRASALMTTSAPT